MVIYCERKIDTVYAGKVWGIWAGSVKQVFAGRSAGAHGIVAFCALEDCILGGAGFSRICIFQNVF